MLFHSSPTSAPQPQTMPPSMWIFEKNWKGCINHGKAFPSSMGKQEIHHEDQNCCLSHLHSEHLTLRQWILDNLNLAGKVFAHLSHEMPRRILSIFWKDKVVNSVTLERADIASMYTLLS